MNKKLPLAIELVKAKDLAGLKKEFKTAPLDVVGGLLRSVFVAPKGKKLVICDLSAIENRGLGYVAEDETVLEVFRKGLDPYLNFAATMYQIPYESITTIDPKTGEHKPKDADAKEKRQNAKPAVLGCVASGTPVLTNEGWIPIQKVTSKHLVFDGLTFVSNSGTVWKGEKEVINELSLTPDHEVLISEEEWNQACTLNIQSGQQALDLACGKLLNLLDLEVKNEGIFVNVKDVEILKKFILRIWKQERQHPAFVVPINEIVKKKAAFTSNLNTSREKLLIVLLTDIMLFCRAVAEQDEQAIVTRGGELLANFQMYTVLFGTLSHWMALITQISIWIEKIIADTTKKGTFGSFPTLSTQTIQKVIDLLSGMASCFQLQDFGLSTVPNTEMLEQLGGNSAKEFNQNKSLENKTTAVVDTYDVTNVGPRNRYTILTPQGILIVHNCGYMLSGGEETVTADGDKFYTGLMGYARNMGIPIPQELADRSVEVFRAKHKKVTQCWYNLENAAMRCIRTGWPQVVGPIKFELFEGVLRMILPSGRSLHYLEPKIMEREWFGKTKETIECWGMDQKAHIWTRIYTYGGKLLENAVQAISRDILCCGMLEATKIGFQIVMHCHDEIVAEVEESSLLGIKQLRECMIKKPWWGNNQLLIDAAGFESQVYKKE